ncbi:hypothetical protein F5877DRAFT_81389 [Lentinula edodes]|nr:hypothetical protein F5877DRAFT_81389 [Lentinula edodes]
MRLVTSLVLILGFVSLASAAPLDIRRPSSHIDVTIAFEENPLEGIHTHLTQAYTNAVKEDVRSLVKSIAGRDLGAPKGSALLFHWIGTPSPDTAKPVMFDISTKDHGRYRVAMSHRTPMHDVIVTDSLGHPVRTHGDLAVIKVRDQAFEIRAPSSHVDITVTFEGNPEKDNESFSKAYTNAIKKDVRALLKNVAARDLGAPAGEALLFHWVGVPTHDSTKPVMYDVMWNEVGPYKVVMSHKTPMKDAIVKNARGGIVRNDGDRELFPYRSE